MKLVPINESGMKYLTYKDVPKAAYTLFHSFRTDPLGQLLTSHLKNEKERNMVEMKLYECYLKQHINKGICIGINESEKEFETVAIWATPTSEEEGLYSFSNLMDSSFDELYSICDDESREKIFNGLLPLLHDSFDEIMNNDSRFHKKNVWTLVYLGLLASARGKGNVRKMFNFLFENYVDVQENSLCYLESSSSDNIPIYNRFGFHTHKDILLGKKSANSQEGKDYAIMNVMIRGYKGEDWTKQENTLLHVKL